MYFPWHVSSFLQGSFETNLPGRQVSSPTDSSSSRRMPDPVPSSLAGRKMPRCPNLIVFPRIPDFTKLFRQWTGADLFALAKSAEWAMSRHTGRSPSHTIFTFYVRVHPDEQAHQLSGEFDDQGILLTFHRMLPKLCNSQKNVGITLAYM